MLNYKKYITFFLLSLFSYALVGCGVKGELKLPEDKNSQSHTVKMDYSSLE